MHKVSILVPVYNSERYLEMCLNSVLQQTLRNIEIICINDGSTDDSLNIIKEFQLIDNRIKVIDKANTGYGDSLNQGLEISNGEYIAVVESDDFIEPEMLQYLYEKAFHGDLDIIKSNYYEYKTESGDIPKCLTNGTPYNEVFVPSDYHELFTGEIYLWTSLYKRSFLEDNNIKFNNTPGASYQDVSFTFKALACAQRAMSVEGYFYHYRLDNPTSSVKSKEKVYCICDEFAEINRFCDERHDIRARMKNIIPYMMFRRYMGTYWRIDRRFKAEFLIRLKDDMSKCSEEDINQEIWEKDDWDFYTCIDEKCKEIVLSLQKKDLIEEAILSKIRDKKVYVYGAGKVGKKVKNWLSNHGIKFSGFLVTMMDGNMNDYVFAFSEISSNLDEDSFILVSVGEKLQSEVIVYLIKNGKRNFIIMSNEMRSILEIV